MIAIADLEEHFLKLCADEEVDVHPVESVGF
jgi:hypothetical protein